MKVLQLDTIRHWCGTEEVTLQLTRALLELGVDVTLVTHPRGELLERAKAGQIPLATVNTRTQVDPIAFFSFLRLFRRARPDIVQLNASRDHLSAGLAAKVARIPIVVRRGIALRLKPRQRYFYDGLPSAIVAPSQAVAAQLREDGVRPALVHIIPNCLDLSQKQAAPEARARIRAELGLSAERPVVAIIARLIGAKGHTDLFEAVNLLGDRWPDLTVLVAGTGPKEEALKAKVTELGLAARVLFLGFRKDVADLYAASDIAAVPSIWPEAFGYAAIEALAVGTPVIASNHGALPELVPEGQAGLLIPPGNAPALAAALDKLLSDPALRSQYGNFGRSWVERYEAAPVAREYLRLYERLASARAPR